MKYSENQALAKMAAYCSKGERSAFDVKRRLQSWDLDMSIIKKVIDRLIVENFLNEERYCRAFIKDKIRFNRWGKAKIVFELKKKKISNNCIDLCFAEIDSDLLIGQLHSLLSTKLKSLKGKDDHDKRNKLMRFGISRGFSIEQTKKVAADLLNGIDDEYIP